MSREQSLTEIYAIELKLANKHFEEDRKGFLHALEEKYSHRPSMVIEKLFIELVRYRKDFSEQDEELFNLIMEGLSELKTDEFNDESLGGDYLLHLAKTTSAINHMVGVEEAGTLLGLSPGTIKNKCAAGELNAKKIGKTWIIDKRSLKNKEELK